MTNEVMTKCFNEWMRRYVDDPAAFEAEFQTVGKFLAEENEGQEPTYGEHSSAYMAKLAEELGLSEMT